MATRWSDQDISATLNQMGLPTGQNKTWTAHRVNSTRRVGGIHAYKFAEKNGALTLRQAAARRGVASHRLRKLIKAGILRAEQVVGRAVPDPCHRPSYFPAQKPRILERGFGSPSEGIRPACR
jgi:hypothetical protein